MLEEQFFEELELLESNQMPTNIGITGGARGEGELGLDMYFLLLAMLSALVQYLYKRIQ